MAFSPRSVAVEAVLSAGQLLRERLGRVGEIRFKGAVNLVTEADVASERLILERIRSAFPEHAVLSEEVGASEGATGSRYLWVVDPLDGTTNFAHGYPQFAVSIAFVIDGVTELGVVYQPVTDELFLAQRGAGAFRNGHRIRVSDEDTLLMALLATGFPYDLERRKHALRHFAQFTTLARAIRRDGSAGLDLCAVAAGRFDGFWEPDLAPWDTAAGALIVREAGGTVTDYTGSPLTLESVSCVASNGKLHQAMLDVLHAD